MQEVQDERKRVRRLILLGITMYFASYVTRINYGAILVEFVKREGVQRSAASVITTVAFITYGLGQLLSGALGDRYSPVRLITCGLGATVLMNFLMPVLSPHVAWMTVVWGINGMAQAFMWPPLVKILMCALSSEDYHRAVPLISIGSSGGSIAVYLLSPLLIRLSGWRLVFYASAGLGLCVTVLWDRATRRLLKGVQFTVKKTAPATPAKKEELSAAHRALSILPVLILIIAIQGMLRDGITTWVPSLISDTFHVESAISILTSVALPIAHFVCNLFLFRVLVWRKNNVFSCMSLYYFATLFFLLLIACFGTLHLASSIIFLMGVNAMINSVNSLQTCYLPECYKALGRDAFFAGLLNFFVYIGSAISTFLFAVLSERFGWGVTVWSWVLLCMLGFALSLFCQYRMRNRQEA